LVNAHGSVFHCHGPHVHLSNGQQISDLRKRAADWFSVRPKVAAERYDARAAQVKKRPGCAPSGMSVIYR
jgi:hypothetical protein